MLDKVGRQARECDRPRARPDALPGLYSVCCARFYTIIEKNVFFQGSLVGTHSKAKKKKSVRAVGAASFPCSRTSVKIYGASAPKQHMVDVQG